MPLIKVKELVIGYDQKLLTKPLNFEINSGDYICIIGENGAGKSTLVKTLLGLNNKLSGEIVLNQALKVKEIGYLPQQSMIQREFPASVLEVVLSGYLNQCGLRPFYNKKERKGAIENLEKLGIKQLKETCYRELSGGQQQRVLLARALCATQKLILLDEPTAGLDPIATKELYALTKRINQEMDITVIMVTHDVKVVPEVATHVLYLEQDTVFFGTLNEFNEIYQGQVFLGGVRID